MFLKLHVMSFLFQLYLSCTYVPFAQNIDQDEAMRLSPNVHIVENNELCIYTYMVNTFLYGIKYE